MLKSFREQTHPVQAARGLSQLTIDGVLGTTRLVETFQQTVLSLGGVLDPKERTRAPVSVVYRSIESVTKVVGVGLDTGFKLLEYLPLQMHVSADYANALAILNGVLGDHLAKQDNALAIPMTLWREGQPVESLDALDPDHCRISVLAHGLCMHDAHWIAEGDHLGARLKQELDTEVLYLRYNSGLHIGDNGQQLAALLDRLLSGHQQNVTIDFVGHSMGGLVIRSALEHARRAGYAWLDQVDHYVSLGTPHDGAPLEQLGNLVDRLLDMNVYSAPFSRLGKIRSCGITDLRKGHILALPDGMDRFANDGHVESEIALPATIKSLAVASTLDLTPHCLNSLVGDGLVPAKSALGLAGDALDTSRFDQPMLFKGLDHIALMKDAKVFEAVLNFFRKA